MRTELIKKILNRQLERAHEVSQEIERLRIWEEALKERHIHLIRDIFLNILIEISSDFDIDFEVFI